MRKKLYILLFALAACLNANALFYNICTSGSETVYYLGFESNLIRLTPGATVRVSSVDIYGTERFMSFSTNGQSIPSWQPENEPGFSQEFTVAANTKAWNLVNGCLATEDVVQLYNATYNSYVQPHYSTDMVFVKSNSPQAVDGTNFVEVFVFGAENYCVNNLVAWEVQQNGTGTAYNRWADNHEFYANWYKHEKGYYRLYGVSATCYTLTYDANGGTNAPSADEFCPKGNITSSKPSKSGKVFVEWNTAADGSGTAYQRGAEIELSADLTLYAQWTDAVYYSLSYDGNGNTSGSAPAPVSSILSGDDVVVDGAGTLAKTDYDFAGWNTAADGSGTHYDASSFITITANTTLYAEWEYSYRTLTYDANDWKGSNVYPPVTVAKGSQVTIAAIPSDLTRGNDSWKQRGYWATTEGGASPLYYAGNVITLNEDMRIYVAWVWNKADLTYNANGATSGTAPAKESIIMDAPHTLLGNPGNLAKTGYIFNGWNSKADGTGTHYDATGSISISANTTIYAEWLNGFSVVYHSNGANKGDEPAMQMCNVGDVVSVSGRNTLDKTDCQFLGWTKSADGTGKMYQPNDTLVVNRGVDLYAQWQCNYHHEKVVIRLKDQEPVYNNIQVYTGVTTIYFTGQYQAHLVDVDMSEHSMIISTQYGDFTYLLEYYGRDIYHSDGKDYIKDYYYIKNSDTEYWQLYQDGYNYKVRFVDNIADADIFAISYAYNQYGLDGNWNEHFIKESTSDNPVFEHADATDTTKVQYQGIHLVRVYTDYNMRYADILHKNTGYDRDYDVLGELPYGVSLEYELIKDKHADAGNVVAINDTMVTVSTGADLYDIVDAHGNYIDLYDTLKVTAAFDEHSLIDTITNGLKQEGWTMNNLPHFQKVITRKTYHVRNEKEVNISANVTEHEFSYQANTAGETFTFNLNALYLDATRTFDKDENVTHEIINESTVLPVDLDADGAMFRILGRDGLESTEFSIVSHTSNTITVRANQDGYNSPRAASLKINVPFTHHDTLHTSNITLTLKQQSIFAGASQLLVHTPGYYEELSSTGEQKVHTATKVIYARPGDKIQLRLAEQEFYGWMRWYDYDTKTCIDDQYVYQMPVNTGGSDHRPHNYRVIGDDNRATGGANMTQGIYTIFTSNYNSVAYNHQQEDKMILPILVMPNDGNGHKVACDVSNYIDFSPADTTALFDAPVIYEPTLSYREIFEVRPASDIADSLDNCRAASQSVYDKNENFYEDHLAIVGKPLSGTKYVYVNTEYRYKNYRDTSELCYYYNENGKIKRVGIDVNASWYRVNGTSLETNNIGSVETLSDCFKFDLYPTMTADTITYILRTDNGINLVRYRLAVQSVAAVGPLKETDGVAILTKSDIETKYQVLATQDFDFSVPGTEYMTTYPKPLAWDQCSYGYANNTETRQDNRLNKSQFTRKGYPQYTFPYFGEYVFINRLQRSSGGVEWLWWPVADMEQRGGAANGYMMYCDGTMEPGTVCELTIHADLCPGQKMYCSGWLANATTDGTHPSFSMRVQGSNDDVNWTTVTEYLTGDLDLGNFGSWKQFLFEINLEQSFEKYRLEIFNFANSSSGNDFLLDDIVVFATPNPVTALQATSECGEDVNKKKMALRVDYDDINDEYRAKDLYYTIKDMTNDTIVMPLEGYYGTVDANYGHISVPTSSTYLDTTKIPIYNSLLALLEADVASGYVKEIADIEGNERYILYIVHRGMMSSEDEYKIIVANSLQGLQSDICHLEYLFNVVDLSKLEVDGMVVKADEREGLCGNTTHTLAVRSFEVTAGDDTQEGHCLSDWLIYKDDYEIADYSKIELIMKALREDRPDNTVNLHATTIHEVDSVKLKALSGYSDAYVILNKLVTNKLLTLSKQQIEVYVPYGTQVQYYIFPIAGTGKSIINPNQKVGVCTQPFIGTVKAAGFVGDGLLHIGVCHYDDLPDALKLRSAYVRASAYDANHRLVLPISDMRNVVVGDSVRLIGTNDPEFTQIYTKYHFSYVPDRKFNFDGDNHSYYKEGDDIIITPSSSNNFVLKEGYEYLFEADLLSPIGSLLDLGCSLGKVLFNLLVVPDYLEWSPAQSDNYNWNTDDNWKTIDRNGNLKDVGSYVPLKHTSVVIPYSATGYPSIDYGTYDGFLTYDVGYTDRTCDTIRFMQGGLMLGQEKLDYNSAQVDMKLNHDQWNLVSMPVKDVVSGDLFTEPNDNDLFTALPQETARAQMPSYIYQSFYNSTVYRRVNEDAQNDTLSAAIGGWSESNDLLIPINIGDAVAVYPFSNPSDTSLIRLPKNDDKYYYYYNSGRRTNRYVDRPRGADHYQLAMDNHNMSTGSMEITLHSNAPTNYFIFGNPAMAYIDMYKFLENNDNVEPEFQYFSSEGLSFVSSSSKLAEMFSDSNASLSSSKDLFLAPMSGVMLYTETPATELTVTLSNDVFSITPLPSQLLYPERPVEGLRSAESGTGAGMLNISVELKGNKSSMRLVEAYGADNGYVKGEDVQLLTANFDAYNTDAFSTPISVYTIADGEALSLDMREDVSKKMIPLCFAVDNVLGVQKMADVTFYGVNSFGYDLYLWDDERKESTLIEDGTMKLKLPRSGEKRYYITASPVGDITTGADETKVDNAVINGTIVYDMVGRVIYQSELNNSEIVEKSLPNGIYIIKSNEGIRKVLKQ